MNVKITTFQVVKEIVSEHPNLNAVEVHKEFKKRVSKSEWRSLNAIQKTVQKIRKNMPDPTPWSIGDRKYDFSPETIAAIFEIKRRLKALDKSERLLNIPSLVCYFIDKLRVAIPDSEYLFAVSLLYADYTLLKQTGDIKELTGVDTSELDAYVIEKNYEALLALYEGLQFHWQQHSYEEMKSLLPGLMGAFHNTANKDKKDGAK